MIVPRSLGRVARLEIGVEEGWTGAQLRKAAVVALDRMSGGRLDLSELAFETGDGWWGSGARLLNHWFSRDRLSAETAVLKLIRDALGG